MNQHNNPSQDRCYCVRIRNPGQDVPRLRRRKPSTHLLSKVAADALRRGKGAERFSCRTVAVGAETEYHCWVETDPSLQVGADLIGLSFLTEDIQRGELQQRVPDDPVAAGLARLVAKHLPPVFGIEVASVDLTPLGKTPPTVCRLLVTEQAGLPVDITPTASPLTDWLQWIDERGLPYLLQVDIESTNNGQYHCWLRAAIFYEGRQLLRDEDIAALLCNDWQGDLAAWYDPEHITSNLQLLRYMGWQARRLPSAYEKDLSYTLEWYPTLAADDIEYTQAVDLLERVRSPTADYRWCLSQTNRLPEDTLYEHLGVAPMLTLKKDELSAVLGLIPGGSTPTQWDDQPARNSPRVEPVEIIQQPAGTIDEETPENTPPTDNAETDSSKTRGDEN